MYFDFLLVFSTQMFKLSIFGGNAEVTFSVKSVALFFALFRDKIVRILQL